MAAKPNYSVYCTLVYRAYRLDTFKDRPLTDTLLTQIRADFAIARATGVKLILRFAYTDKATTGDCPDQYKICPPYGDAPKAIVLEHIRQLGPLMHENADILAVLQMGFIGIWGENYFTDYFGDASTNSLGVVPDSSWRDRNDVLSALLTALPANRMVQVRTPQIKQRFVYGPQAPVTATGMDTATAFGASTAARIGFHNDCFLASPDDYGTFYDVGNSTTKRGPGHRPTPAVHGRRQSLHRRRGRNLRRCLQSAKRLRSRRSGRTGDGLNALQLPQRQLQQRRKQRLANQRLHGQYSAQAGLPVCAATGYGTNHGEGWSTPAD